MSILVEALTLVVPRKVLDVSYPGGTDAFLAAMLELERPPRFVCTGDAHLVNVSFYDPDHLEPAEALLVEHGVVAVDDDRFIELACVDQRYGPTVPCDWLEWRRHSDGFTYAWLAGTEPGDMAAPTDWTPEQSRALVRHDVREEPGRCMRIAAEDGLETWVDFQTGRVVQGVPQRDDDLPVAGVAPAATVSAAPGPLDEPAEPLMPIVLAVLDERGWKHTALDEGSVLLRVRDVRAAYDVFITTDDETRLVCCYCIFSVRVPAARRQAVAELLNRANWTTALGSLELDMDDGEVRHRVSVDVEGGRFGPRMMHNMLAIGLHTAERHHDAVMQVAFGDADPGEAFERIGPM